QKHPYQPLHLNANDSMIMQKSMLAALREACVDNLDAYETVIRHPKTAFVTHDYVACNLIGLVSAVNIARSKVVGGSSDHLLDTDFDGLVIDETRARGLLMFRLAENTTGVVVHEKIRRQLESR